MKWKTRIGKPYTHEFKAVHELEKTIILPAIILVSCGHGRNDKRWCKMIMGKRRFSVIGGLLCLMLRFAERQVIYSAATSVGSTNRPRDSFPAALFLFAMVSEDFLIRMRDFPSPHIRGISNFLISDEEILGPI